MSRRGVSEDRKFSATHYTNRPLLKTLYKDRATGQPVSARQMSFDNAEKLDLSNAFSQQQEEENFRNTSNKLLSTNFSHHDPTMCVCDHCLCGRHLCKLHAIAPDLSKGSVYRQSFRKRGAIPNIVPRAEQAMKNKGPHLDIDSVQRKDFSGRKGDDVYKHHPEDLLKSSGPCPMLTTYNSGFPGYKGANQYVKPTDNMVRGNFPLMTQTTYGKSFGPGKVGRAASLERTPDNLKQSNLWFGKTTYGSNFRAPNPEDYANKIKLSEKLNDEPKYPRQYETIYKNDFLSNVSTVCPAKIALESKIKGQLSTQKGKFSENMDYKALSPEYHALSLSKQSFV